MDSSSSIMPPVARPSVWQTIPKDTLRWATDLSLRGGPALVVWVNVASFVIGKIGKVNHLIPAISLYAGVLAIKIFKRCNDHFNGNNQNKHGLFLAVGYFSLITIHILAISKFLGPNNKAMYFAIPAFLWADMLAMAKN